MPRAPRVAEEEQQQDAEAVEELRAYAAGAPSRARLHEALGAEEAAADGGAATSMLFFRGAAQARRPGARWLLRPSHAAADL